MRSVLFLPLLLLTSVAHAAAPVPAPAAFAKVFELAGIRLLCEQTEPLLQRGVPAAQQAQLSQVFTAEQLCGALAKQLAPGFTAAQLQTMESMLESPLAKQFTAAERAVGDDEKAGEGDDRRAGERPLDLDRSNDAHHQKRRRRRERRDVGTNLAVDQNADHGDQNRQGCDLIEFHMP